MTQSEAPSKEQGTRRAQSVEPSTRNSVLQGEGCRGAHPKHPAERDRRVVNVDVIKEMGVNSLLGIDGVCWPGGLCGNIMIGKQGRKEGTAYVSAFKYPVTLAVFVNLVTPFRSTTGTSMRVYVPGSRTSNQPRFGRQRSRFV